MFFVVYAVRYFRSMLHCELQCLYVFMWLPYGVINENSNNINNMGIFNVQMSLTIHRLLVLCTV